MTRWAKRIGHLALLIVTLLAASPILSVLVASSVASSLGCRLDEGDVHPCLFHGHDLGALLYAMGVLGWLMLVTGPPLMLLLLVWFLMALRALVRRHRRLKAGDRSSTKS